MNQIQAIKLMIINDVCKVSVTTIVFTPPSNVYNKIINNNTNVVAQNGTPKLSNKNICNTFTTKYKRAVAPIPREIIKKTDPILCASTLKRFPK